MGPSQRSPMARSIARAVRGASGMTAFLPPLRVIARVRCPRSAGRFDVGAGGLGHPQPVQGEQRERGVLGGGATPGGGEERADFVAVQAGGMGFAVELGTADVSGRGLSEEVFLDRVLVQAGDGGQPPGDGRPGPPGRLEVAGEQLDVGAADREQPQLPLAAPGGELAQVQRVGLPGQAAVPGQEPG